MATPAPSNWSATLAPSGSLPYLYDIAINGVGYLVAWEMDRELLSPWKASYDVSAEDILIERQDHDTGELTENKMDLLFWKQNRSWDYGAGIIRFPPDDDPQYDSRVRGFFDSTGLDVLTTPGQLVLLPSTSTVYSLTNTKASNQPQVVTATGTAVYVAAAVPQILKFSNLSASDATLISSGTTTNQPVFDLTTDGQNAYAALGQDGVTKALSTTSTLVESFNGPSSAWTVTTTGTNRAWADNFSNSSTNVTLNYCMKAMLHLSDGTLVYFMLDPATSLGTALKLKWSNSHTGADGTVGTVSSSFNNLGSGGYQTFAICRDSSDNIYLFGSTGSNPVGLIGQAFTKGAGHTWTAQTAQQGVFSVFSETVLSVIVTWCNTGGGTNNKGHIVVLWSASGDATRYSGVDAGALLNGSALNGTGPYTFPSPNGSGQLGDISNDGFGATNGVAGVTGSSASNYSLSSWSINSSGTITVTSITNNSSHTFGISLFRFIRYASNSWALVWNSSATSNQYGMLTMSSTAIQSSVNNSGAITNMPNLGTVAQGFDAFLDPVTANQIWLMTAPQADGKIWRVSISMSGYTPTWSTTAILDDTVLPLVGVNDVIRCVPQPTVTVVDYQFANANNPPDTTEVLSDFAYFGSLALTTDSSDHQGNSTGSMVGTISNGPPVAISSIINQATETFNASRDFSASDSFSMYFKANTAGTFQIQFITSAGNYFYINEAIAGDNAWHLVTMNRSAFTTVGTPNWNNINSLAVNYPGTPTGAFKVDDLEVVGGGAFYAFNSTDARSIGWAKDRLYVAGFSQPGIYQFVEVSSMSSKVWLTLPAGFSVPTGTIRELGGYVYFGAAQSGVSKIYGFDGASVPFVSCTLPYGDTLTMITPFLGAGLLVGARRVGNNGTSAGMGVLYRAFPDSTGHLTLERIAIYGFDDGNDYAPLCGTSWAEQVYYGWPRMGPANPNSLAGPSFPGTSAATLPGGIGAYSPATGGYARHLEGVTSANTQTIGVTVFKNRRIFTQDGVGVMVEQPTFRSSGTLYSSVMDWNVDNNKQVLKAEIGMLPLPAGTSVEIDYSYDGPATVTSSQTWQTAGVAGTTGATLATFPIYQPAQVAQYRIIVTSDSSHLTTPTLKKAGFGAVYGIKPRRLYKIVVKAYSYLELRNGVPHPNSGPKLAHTIETTLEALRDSQQIVSFQPAGYGEENTDVIPVRVAAIRVLRQLQAQVGWATHVLVELQEVPA